MAFCATSSTISFEFSARIVPKPVSAVRLPLLAVGCELSVTIQFQFQPDLAHFLLQARCFSAKSSVSQAGALKASCTRYNLLYKISTMSAVSISHVDASSPAPR